MKDKIKLEFDRYELGIVINALNQFRNAKKQEEMDTSPIDEILKRLIDEGDRKKIFKDYGDR